MSQYGATESLIGMVFLVNSQCKLATLRRKNRKIQYKNKIFKANEQALEWVVT
jgi:hypothetical protein